MWGLRIRSEQRAILHFFAVRGWGFLVRLIYRAWWVVAGGDCGFLIRQLWFD